MNSFLTGCGCWQGDRKVHEDRWRTAADASKSADAGGRTLREIELLTPIRYSAGDPVEAWLNDLLCLDVHHTHAQQVGGLGLDRGAQVAARRPPQIT